MKALSDSERERLTEASRTLLRVHKQLPVLKVIAWPRATRDRFFQRGERELPRVTYRGYDPSNDLAAIAHARALAPRTGTIGAWLRRQGDALACTASMLAAVGTPAFSRFAQQLYGRPTDHFPNTNRSPLELARRLVRTADRVSESMPPPPPPTLLPEDIAAEIRFAVRRHFGDKAPSVEIVPNLAARASAGAKRIRLRADARFSDLDARQLIHHEAFVHVATALNGRLQRRLPLLAANHAGTTRTQEGLAVFAELISGALDPQRFLRLAHRVIAVQLALDGADFLEVYRYYLDHSPTPIEAYESTTRVFRGGLVEGGAPFTKDMVYLDGLCRVHVYIRATVDTGRIDCLQTLFTGKLDLQDVASLIDMRRKGMTSAPKYLPPWVSDPRRLVAYFAVTDIIGRASTGGLREHYVDVLRSVPRFVPDEASSLTR